MAVGIRHEMRMRHVVICGLSSSTKFFSRYLISGMIVGKRLLTVKCVLISSTAVSVKFYILLTMHHVTILGK